MPKIALVHDYLREYGGAERVLEALHQMFPQAPVYVAFKDDQALGIHATKFADWDIKETWLGKIPLIKKLYSPLRFLAPKAFSDLDLSKFEIVISSSNAYYAKAVKVPNGKHFCYCHTPPRSLYGYTTMSNWQNHLWTRIFGQLINHYLRIKDFQMAQKVDVFIANSLETQKRIKKFYRKDSVVIYPPVELKRTKNEELRTKNYYLYVNRLALAKHPELAVEAANKLKLPLKVAGMGPMLDGLKKLAKSNIEFLGAVDDQKLIELYAGAKALIYPVEDEDFGMIPVEAMSFGVPVIAHRSGGPKETVIENKTGVFFDELNLESLTAAIKKFTAQKFDAQMIKAQAQKFSLSEFQRKIINLIRK